MKILVFGGGDLAEAFKRAANVWGYHDVTVLERADVDVRHFARVVDYVRQYRPDFIVCTAGLSDRRVGVSIQEVVDTNLVGAMYVGTAAAAYEIPCLLVASTAGLDPGQHAWYGAAKAGVINFVRATARKGAKIWAISPGRMDTKMRQDDWPDEDPQTRLDPAVVAVQMLYIVGGDYAPGANVVVRKVGLERTDVYEEVATSLPSLI